MQIFDTQQAIGQNKNESLQRYKFSFCLRLLLFIYATTRVVDKQYIFVYFAHQQLLIQYSVKRFQVPQLHKTV